MKYSCSYEDMATVITNYTVELVADPTPESERNLGRLEAVKELAYRFLQLKKDNLDEWETVQ
jgi:hypothetical protein